MARKKEIATFKAKGMKLFNDGDAEGAIKVYDEALEKFPDENQFLLYKATALSELKQFDDCIKICD